MKLNILFSVLLISMLAGSAYATNNAALQITSYSTVPDAIYAGVTGQLQVTILNSGTDTAAQTTVSYLTPGESSYSDVSVGDIGAGSSAVASVPFTVPQKTGSGYFTIYLNVVYYSDAAHTSIKNTPTTIPIIVLQHQVMAVKTLSIEPQSIQPGDNVTSKLEITNTGGTMNNVVISTPDNSSFSIEGASQQAVGTIAFNSSINVSVALRSSSSAPTGKYTIPVLVSYQDSLQNTVNQTVYIGPVVVTDSSAQFRIYLTPVTSTEAGSESQFDLTLENLAGSNASAIVDLNQTTEFTPIGATRTYFDDVGTGENQTKIITIGVGATTLAGYYNLPITITINGKAYSQNIGIAVNATPEIQISSETTPEFVSTGSSGVKVVAQIANTGNGPIRSVYVSAQEPKNLKITGTTDKFIGTLNVDDFATFQLTVNVPQNLSPGDYTIPIVITFKDSKNGQHNISKDVDVTVYSGQDAARMSLTGGTSSSSTSTTAYSRSSGGLFGLGLIPTIAGALVLLILGYFGYKKYKGGKKQKIEGQQK